MKTVARHLELAYPEFNKERSVVLATLESAKTQGLGGPDSENGVVNISALLVVAAGSILLIACANVANLLLARATTRQREMAVRLALGASRGRIVRQLLTESILLALLGGIGGVILAYWLGDLLLALLPATPMPLALDCSPDLRVLVYALLLALFSGVIFGLAPALQTARWDLTQGLRERASSSWWRHVALELAESSRGRANCGFAFAPDWLRSFPEGLSQSAGDRSRLPHQRARAPFFRFEPGRLRQRARAANHPRITRASATQSASAPSRSRRMGSARFWRTRPDDLRRGARFRRGVEPPVCELQHDHSRIFRRARHSFVAGTEIQRARRGKERSDGRDYQ